MALDKVFIMGSVAPVGTEYRYVRILENSAQTYHNLKYEILRKIRFFRLSKASLMENIAPFQVICYF